MKWHVIWIADAENDFQRLLVLTQLKPWSPSKRWSDFSNKIPSMLESHERILFHHGYAVLYGVAIDDHFVFINAFWRWAK